MNTSTAKKDDKISKVVVTKKPVTKKEETKKEEVAEVNRTIPNSIAERTFYLGKAPYNPRAAHNADSWNRMLTHLAKGGTKGSVLATELVVNGKHPDRTHFDFISYLERRGALSNEAPKK